MKNLLLLSLTTVLFTSAYGYEVLVETNESQNIRLNGKSFNYCAIVSEAGETNIDKKKAKFISIVIGNKGEYLDKVSLFRIDESGDLVRRHYYPDSDQIANNLSQKDIEYGYKFEADSKKVKFTNGSSCMDRSEFLLKMSNGDLSKTKSIQWNQGVCNTGQILLAVPSAIFGADIHGNDLKCKFN